jgi:xylulokinase
MSDGPLALVLDLGTHKCSAVAMELHGTVVATAVSPRYPTWRENPGWAEQEPTDWWSAAIGVIRQVREGLEHREVVGLITVGHGPSHLPVDADLNPIGRSLIWQDTRAREEAAWIEANTATEQRFEALGLHLPIAPGMGPAKLLWLRDKQPERYRNTVALIQPKDFITLCLTGTLVTDRYGMKDLVHADTGVFNEWYADALGLRRDLLPDITTPWSVVGRTTAQQQEATGLPVGIPVACGTIDAFSGLIGSGGHDEGDVCDVSGTSEIIGLIRHAPPQPFEGFLCYPLVAGYSVVFGVTRAAGDSIDWYLRKIAGADDLGAWITGFEERQSRQDTPADGMPVMFWPYLDGERSPYWNADLRGMFMGLSPDTEVDTMARAVFDGVAMTVRHNLDLLHERTGTTPTRMWTGGGTSRSMLLNQIKADVTGLEVHVPLEFNSTARGALAMLLVALGGDSHVLDTARQLTGESRVIYPRGRWQDYYDAMIPTFKRVGELVGPVYQEMAVVSAQSNSQQPNMRK